MSRAQLNYEDGLVRNIHYGDILVRYGSILNVKKEAIPFISNANMNKYKSNLLKNGDVVFADAAEDDIVGKAVEISEVEDVFLVAGLHTIVARPKIKLANNYSGYYLNSKQYHSQLLRLMQGSKVSSISKKNLQYTCFKYPLLSEEQNCISEFFKSINDTITLHQRKASIRS